MPSFLSDIDDPHSVITPIENGILFPEVIALLRAKYEGSIREFARLVSISNNSAELLNYVRNPRILSEQRMSLLKLFRRCAAGVLDTEMTKKIRTVSTRTLIENYGSTFKPIGKLKEQFADLDDELISVLAVTLGEYDNRGKQGYFLTAQFFDWFEAKFVGELKIEGPRGAGRDIELSSVVPAFKGSCPCDFVIRNSSDLSVIAVGFARYDSTRGGAQSDDRTGGNSSKVYMIREYCAPPIPPLRILFVADGPGLAHRDTWNESVKLDGSWNDNVRVTTLKLADEKVTLEWLRRRYV